MKRKLNNLPDFKHTPAMPEQIEKKTAEQATGDILTTIRQFEPEEQNAIVSHLLKELVTDRFNSVKSTNEARDRAAKNAELFMMATRDIDVTIKEKEYR